MALDKKPSNTIVCELIRVLGSDAVSSLLKVTNTRLKALRTGRGCLADEQLERITSGTGRSWMRWGVEALTRGKTTAQLSTLDKATFELLDKIDPLPKKPPARRATRRSKTLPIRRATLLRHAVWGSIQ